jgi:hypothetical protein
MSHPLIDRSPDLRRLVEEGYEIELSKSENHLLVKSVPYVNSKGEVKLGTLVSTLALAGSVTTSPDTHVAKFVGEHPCNANGSEIAQIKHGTANQELDKGLIVNHSFSAKANYRDYHHKMTTYVGIISGPAQAIDPDVTAKTFAVIVAPESESVFQYVDSASSRAQINSVSRKLEGSRIAIVGVGGTGSYVLDLIAKTRAAEIHLFDGDTFGQHNAFRAPGAAALSDLEARMKKVDYLKSIYDKMHRHIIAHPYHVTETNVDELRGVTFVFICMDSGRDKLRVVEKLEEWSIPFVDVGMGLKVAGDSLTGIVRLTTSTPGKRDHVRSKRRISFADPAGENVYAANIQIADLNALNAALAVIKFKKLLTFYSDLEREHFSLYAVGGNHIANEDQI